ncbi:MAG: hypothetical protein IPH51_20690 [Rubrivivax sp.]|nr:hypothetical protein [Rubrivivax sp.]
MLTACAVDRLARRRLPLLSADEMANTSPADIIARLQRGAQADAMRRVFGAQVFDNVDTAFDAMLFALEVFPSRCSPTSA